MKHLGVRLTSPGVVPGEAAGADALLAEGSVQTEVVEEDGRPRDEHTATDKVNEPVEDGEGARRERHEGEEREEDERRDGDIRDTPGRGAEEDGRGVALDGETVEDTGSGKERLVRGRPGRGDDHGVDDRGDGLDAGGGRSDDERRGGGGSRVVLDTRVVGRDEHADDEDREDVEDGDTREHALDGLGDRLAGVTRLGGGHGDRLGAGEGEDGIDEHSPEAEEAAPRALGDVGDERARVLPVAETDALDALDAAARRDEAEDDQADNEQDLDDGKAELDLAKVAHLGERDHGRDDDEDDDPDGRVEVGAPEGDEHADGRDLGRDRKPVSVDNVPTEREAEGGVGEQLRVAHERTGDGHEGRHFSESELHRAYDEADEEVRQERAEGAARRDRTAEREEETGADGACGVSVCSSCVEKAGDGHGGGVHCQAVTARTSRSARASAPAGLAFMQDAFC